jgi:hypothetical protein
LKVHGINDVRQTEIHTLEPLVSNHGHFVIEIAIEKLKRYKSPRSNQISTEVIQAGGNTLRSEVHKLINSVWNKEDVAQQ